MIKLFQSKYCNSSYLKSSTTLKKKILDISKYYKSEMCDRILKQIQHNRVFNLYVDEWTDSSYKRYLNNILSNSHSNFNLGLIYISTPLTTEILYSLISSSLKRFGVSIKNDISCLVTDGCPLMVSLSKLFPGSLFICFAHTIHLLMTKMSYGKYNENRNLKIDIIQETQDINFMKFT